MLGIPPIINSHILIQNIHELKVTLYRDELKVTVNGDGLKVYSTQSEANRRIKAILGIRNNTNFHYLWEGLKVQHSSCDTILHNSHTGSHRHTFLASSKCLRRAQWMVCLRGFPAEVSTLLGLNLPLPMHQLHIFGHSSPVVLLLDLRMGSVSPFMIPCWSHPHGSPQKSVLEPSGS